MFDTLMYAKRLEAAGLTREQAETQIQIISEMVVDGVATKQDLQLAKQDVLLAKQELRQEILLVKADVDQLRSEMRVGFADLENRLTTRLGLMIAATTTLTITVLSILK